jgi:hypothetical protein
LERKGPEAFSCQPTDVDGLHAISTLSESTVESAKGRGLAQLWHSWVCQTKRLFVSPFTKVTYEEPFSASGEDRIFGNRFVSPIAAPPAHLILVRNPVNCNRLRQRLSCSLRTRSNWSFPNRVHQLCTICAPGFPPQN